MAKRVDKREAVKVIDDLCANEIMWRQALLNRPTRKGIEAFVCWLPSERNVKKGSIITLYGERAKWTVMWQSSEELPSTLIPNFQYCGKPERRCAHEE